MTARNLTYDSLSSLSGLARSTIANYLAGNRSPRAEELCYLADALGVSMDYLWGREDDSNNYEKRAKYKELSHAREQLQQGLELLNWALLDADDQGFSGGVTSQPIP